MSFPATDPWSCAEMLALLGFVVYAAAVQTAEFPSSGEAVVRAAWPLPQVWRLPAPGPLRAPTALPRPRLGDFTLVTRSPPRLDAPPRWPFDREAASLLDRRFPLVSPVGADTEGQVVLGMAF